MLGDLLINLMIGCLILLYFLAKIVRTVDDDGEMGKTTSKGVASLIERLFK